MRLNIKYRLFFALLVASALVALGMLLIVQWSLDRGFLQYVNTLDAERLERLAVELEERYDESGDWAFLREDPGSFHRLVLLTGPERAYSPEQLERLERRLQRHRDRPQGGGEGRGLDAQRFEQRLVLLDSQKRLLYGPGKFPGGLAFRELSHRRQIVGYLGLVPRKDLADANQLRFVREQQWSMLLIAALAVVVSALLALPLARRLARPIHTLALATRRLAAGDFTVRTPAERGDELGQLARDFNSLALTLEKNEEARRRWIADISHELRTPLAVLRGEIEALQDGIRQAGPQTLASLHGEVMRLGRLVEDLYQLALSDVGALTYRKNSESLVALLEQALAAARSEFDRKGIALRFEAEGVADATLFADRTRLGQLFANLLDNSRNYTDPGGELAVRLEQEPGSAVIHFQDSPPGVPEGELERLFERLYRVESSRNRNSGGAGLGLSICRNIVEAHGGTISAQTSPLGGVWITVRLPLEVAP